MNLATQNAPKALDSVLKHYGVDVKKDVTHILAEYGIQAHDPIAAVISSIYVANLKNLAELAKVPSTFQAQVKDEVQSFGEFSRDLKEQMRGILAEKNIDFSQSLGAELKTVVAKALVDHHKRLAKFKAQQLWLMAGIPAFGIALLVMLGGVGLGAAWTMYRVSQGGQAKVLSSAELAALQWLTSEEGKLAWEMGVHNRGVIQQCFEGVE